MFQAVLLMEKQQARPLPPSCYVKAAKILDYLRRLVKDSSTEICSADLKETLVAESQPVIEALDWDEIIVILQQQLQGRHCDPLVHYHALLLKEELLLHRLQEEKLRLQLEEKKTMLLHTIDQVIYKASCLASCLQAEPVGIEPGTAARSLPTTQDLVQQLCQF